MTTSERDRFEARLIAACHRLRAESRACEFDDGLGRGVQQTYWDEFEPAHERASTALDTVNKTMNQLHADQPPVEPCNLDPSTRDAIRLATILLENHGSTAIGSCRDRGSP